MTKFYIRVFAAAALLTAVCSFGVQADTAYKTITIDRNKQYIETQTAYKPIGFIAKIGEKNISAPADMTIFDQKLYICDTGNSCIKVSDLSGNLLNTIGDGILQEPTGIFVNSKEIFVADKSLKKVLMFSHDGTVLREYNRPQEPLYGKKSDFIPIKVAVDSKDNLFVVSSGNTNGIVQISKSTGEFLGYFGANPTIVDLWDKISNVIFTKEQKDQTQKNMPTSVNNLTIDSLGMIYTITDIQTDEMIRKLNMSGNNMIRNSVSFPNPVDIVVGNIGNIYVCTKDGYILEYNNEGQLLFLFCGMDDGTQRIGLFSSISAMALDENGRLYVLDDGKNEIQIFAPTEFSNNVHAALDLYQKGKYLQSREPWENVLRMNNMFDYANRGIGFAYYKSEDYIKSMNSFKLANDKSGYSDAYAEHRNILIRDNTIWVIYAVLILFIMRKAIKLIKRKTTVLQPVDAAVGRFLNVPFISQLRYLLVVPRNPAQAYYGIKREKKVSLLSSTALYLLFIVIFIVNKYGSGYLFNTVESGTLYNTYRYCYCCRIFCPAKPLSLLDLFNNQW